MRTLYKNAHLMGKDGNYDLLVTDGRFEAIEHHIEAEATEVSLDGQLVIPPYVEPHIHLDAVYAGGRNGTGTLFEGISRWADVKASYTPESIRERAKKAIRQEMLFGVQYIRTHVDVTEPGLVGLKTMLALRDELKDLVTIQVVAFPQDGFYAFPGGEALVEEALKLGADCVGAIPHNELAREFGEKSLHRAVELAVKYDRRIDVHCDETDDDQSRHLELLTALVTMEGIGSRTTASHTCSFGSANGSYAFRMMANLRRAGINFVSCPTENITLEGRQDSYPKRRGLTRVKELLEAGVNVCFAQDSIEDPWYPLGDGDPMHILDAGIHITQLMSPEEIDNALRLVTINGAKTLGVEDQYGLEAGKDANFIVLDAPTPFEAIRQRAAVRLSVHRGQVLFQRAPAPITAKVPFLA